MVIDIDKLRKIATTYLREVLGREPSDEEIELQVNTWIIDNSGPVVTDYKHPKHKKGK